MRLIWFFRAILLLPALSWGVPGNLVQNGAFYRGLEGWAPEKPAGVKVNLDQKIKHSGRGSCRVEFLGPDDNYFHTNQGVDVEAGATYILRYFIKTEKVSVSGAAGPTIAVQDSRHFSIFYKQAPTTGGTHDWRERECMFTVPEGTTNLTVSLRRIGGRTTNQVTGTAWYDDISIVRFDVTADLDLTAAPPKQLGPDLTEAHQESNRARNRICLNGIWGMQPTNSAALRLPGTWRYGKVPGSDRLEFKQFDANLKPLNPIRQKRLWYERALSVPAAWEGRRLILQFQCISDQAACYVNGKFQGQWRGNWEEIDITSAIRPGEANRLTVLVWGNEFDRWSGKGLTGDVWLLICDPRCRLAEAGITTSVRKKRIQVEVLAENTTGEPCDVRISADVFDGDQHVLSLRPKTLSLEMSGQGTAKLSGKWRDPILWDFENPQLYRLRVRATDLDGNLLDEREERFGFREFGVKGPDFFLNGKKTHLRYDGQLHIRGLFCQNSTLFFRKHLALIKEAGFNGVNPFRYLGPQDALLTVADEMGLGVNISLPDDPVAAARAVRHYRNHPSLFTHSCKPYQTGRTGFGWLVNPWAVDGAYEPDIESYRERRDSLLKFGEALQAIDPTRPMIYYGCGNVGEIYNYIPYLLLGVPLREAEDWPKHWAKVKKKPLFAIEFSFPFELSLDNQDAYDKPARPGVKRERLILENAAEYLGDQAYAMRPGAWQNLTTGGGAAHDQTVEIEPRVTQYSVNDAYLGLVERYALDWYRSWRAYDISGMCGWVQTVSYGNWAVHPYGFAHKDVSSFWQGKDLTAPGPKPDRLFTSHLSVNPGLFASPVLPDYKPTRSFKVMKQVHDPLLIYIGGPKQNHTSKDHAYFTEETVKKSLIIVNDRMSSLRITGHLELVLDGAAPVHVGTIKTKVKPGEVRFVPIKAKLPEDVLKRVHATLSAHVLIDETEQREVSFALEISPHLKLANLPSLALLDQAGLTMAALRRAGIAVKELRSLPADPGTPVFVGRQSLTHELAPKLAEFARTGGTVVLFEQDLASPLAGSLRERSVRDCFRRAPDGDPVLGELTDTDLRNWRGSSTLVEPYPRPDPTTEFIGNGAQDWQKWGNDNTVATFVLQKPTYGSYRVLVDCGFDQTQTVLVEYYSGKGRIICCQLDVTDRIGKDPAATKLVTNLARYAHQPRPVPARFLSACSPEALALLEKLGFEAEAISPTHLDQFAAPAVLVVDAAADAELSTSRHKLDSFVNRGGIVFSLARPTAGPPPWTDLVKLVSQKCFGSDCITGTGTRDSIRRKFGLALGDFWWRRELDMQICQTGKPADVVSPGLVTRIRGGQGQWLFCQVDPRQLSDGRAHAKTIRIVSSLLTQCGVRSRFTVPLTAAPWDLSARTWQFRVDPDELGAKKEWFRPNTKVDGWRSLKVGKTWESQGINETNEALEGRPQTSYNGHAWYRIEVDIPEVARGRRVFLNLGGISMDDWTYLNGSLIGTINTGSNYRWTHARRYELPPEAINFGGVNTLVVKVFDRAERGGLLRTPVCLDYADQPNATALLPQVMPASTYDPYRFKQW